MESIYIYVQENGRWRFYCEHIGNMESAERLCSWLLDQGYSGASIG